MTTIILATAGATLIAYFVNALTAFGSNIIFIPLAAMVLGPKEAVVVCAGLNMFSNTLLVSIDNKSVPRSYWGVLAVVFSLGTMVGALTLKTVPDESFKVLLGIIVVALGVWFLLGRPMRSGRALREDFPERSSTSDCIVSSFAGFCGGSIGINGPPLVWHFGMTYAKDAFRKMLVLLFFPAAFIQFGTYASVGLVSWDTLITIAVCIPTLWLATFLGNKAFLLIDLFWFNRVVGLLMTVIGLKLVFIG